MGYQSFEFVLSLKVVVWICGTPCTVVVRIGFWPRFGQASTLERFGKGNGNGLVRVMVMVIV